MATYAIVNDQNEVLNVIKIADDLCEDENGNEVHEKVCCMRDEICGCDSPQRLIKTSINNNMRGTCARIGDVWNEELEMFVEPKPVDRPTYVLDPVEGTWGPDTSTRPALTAYQESIGGFSYFYNQPREEWVLRFDNSAEHAPELTQEQIDAGQHYAFLIENYVEGDISTGYVLMDPPPEEEEEPVGIAST